jgi:hypothetical protein
MTLMLKMFDERGKLDWVLKLRELKKYMVQGERA